MSVLTTSDSPRALEAWDALAGRGSFYDSAAWQAFSDSDRVSRPRYVAATDADGSPLAVLSVHHSPRENNARYRPPTPDTVLLGGRRGHLSSLLRAPAAPLELVRPMLDRACDDLGLDPAHWWWPYLVGDDALAVATALDAPGPPALLGADCLVEVPEGGLDAHVAALSSRQRRTNTRRELRAFAESGLRIERGPLAGDLDRLGALLSQVQRRYGHDHGPELMEDLLARQAEHLGERAVVHRCLDADGTVVGFSLAYRHGDELALRVVGFDYQRSAQVGEYAHLSIYAPLQLCAEQGLRRLHLGMESFEAKLRRGAVARPLWSVGSVVTGGGETLDDTVARVTRDFPRAEAESFTRAVDEVAGVG